MKTLLGLLLFSLVGCTFDHPGDIEIGSVYQYSEDSLGPPTDEGEELGGYCDNGARCGEAGPNCVRRCEEECWSSDTDYEMGSCEEDTFHP